MDTVAEVLEDVNSKFDSVLIDYEPESKAINRQAWEELQIEHQRELLALGKVRFFKEDSEVPFYRALL